jgi:hypothetical protein
VTNLNPCYYNPQSVLIASDRPPFPTTTPCKYSNTIETPSTSQSTSALASRPAGIDQVTVDSINKIGGFQCSYPGYNTRPFHTLYLLNSYVNVHSLNRPHYYAIRVAPEVRVVKISRESIR